MRILPFMDIPVVEVKTPSEKNRREVLREWAEGDIIRLSVAYLAYIENGENEEDYYFQIGFIHKGNLVTTKEVIEETGNKLLDVTDWAEYLYLLPKLRDHLSLYFDKVGMIPAWGTPKYYKMVEKGKTPRWLEGPHKSGRLKPNQRRKIVLDEKGDIVFGPLIKG